MKNADDGLLKTGTIAIISRDNPVEFKLVCQASAWGVSGNPAIAKGSSAASIKTGLTFDLNADVKKGLNAELGAKYSDKNVLDVSDVTLEERYESDLAVEGSRAEKECWNAVYRKQHDDHLKVSVVTGNIRATIKYSEAISGDVGAKADVKDVVNATVGAAASLSIEGTGANLIWGIKYSNLPDLREPKK
jgi:hypothetical protein